MTKTIAIDGRMWGPNFTGIGNYLREIFTRVFILLPEYHFTLFLPEEAEGNILTPNNVTPLFTSEKIYSLKEQTSFCKKISEVNADLTFFPHFNVPLFFRKKFIVVIHDLTILTFPGKKMSRWWHRQAYNLVLKHALEKSERILSVSDFTKAEIQRFDPNISDEKITVIKNGVCVERFQKQTSIAKQGGLPPCQKEQAFHEQFGSPFFLTSGVWREHKNIPGAIRAFELLRKHGGKGKLVITGKPDPYYPEVESLAKSSPFSEDIILTGFIPDEDMPALLSAADALLFPSFSEGFGLPALEAMAAETPVLSSNRTSLPEVCGDAALFFDPNDPEEMAMKMLDVLEEDTRKELIEKGKEQIKQFSWDAAAEEVANFLR